MKRSWIRCILVLVLGCLATSGAWARGQADSGTAGAVSSEPLTLWIAFDVGKAGASMKSYNEMKMLPLVEKETGVKLQFVHPAAGNQNEQLNLMLASGELPDMIHWGWKNFPGGPAKAIQDKSILSLNALIDKNCPNMKKLIGDYPELSRMVRTDDGTIYMYPFVSLDLRKNPQIPAFQTFGWCIRQDWLQKLGFSLPETMDQWTEILRAFKGKDPNGNGKADEIPFVGIGNGDLSNWIRAWGVNNGFYREDDVKNVVKYGYATPEYKEAVTVLAQWYKEGLIDPDYAATDGKQKDSKITNNLAGSWVGATSGNFGRYVQLMKSKDPTVKLTGLVPPYAKGGKPWKFDDWSMFPITSGTAITTKCKKPDAAARFLDFFYSAKGHMLSNWGIEGESYVVENGQPRFTDLIRKNPDGLSIDQALIRYNWAAAEGPNLQPAELWLERMSLPEQREMLPRWGTGDRTRILPPVTPTPQEAAEFSAVMAEVQTYSNEMFTKFVMGVEPISGFDSYMRRLESLGIRRALEMRQKQLDRYLARK
jgi:putative aldouronate transport system substrate-binding protein